MSNVHVIGGVMREEDGLKASMAKFRRHHAEVGEALLNISGIGTADGLEVDKDEARPAYVHQDWPRLVYHADGRDLTVHSKAELEAALGLNYRIRPFPVPQVAIGNPQQEKQALMDQNRDLQGKLTIQNEMLRTLMDRVDAMEKGSKGKAKAGGGDASQG